MSEKRNVWTHEETVVALGLYFKISFSKCNMFHPEVKRVAELLGRKPSALAMKILNLARLDPTLQRQDISGLKNGAKMEKDVWHEYEGRLDCLAEDLNRLLKEGVDTTLESDEDLKFQWEWMPFALRNSVSIKRSLDALCCRLMKQLAV